MKLSYGRKMWDSNGTFYSQRISMSREEFNKIQQKFLLEIKSNFPNRKKYSSYNNDLDLRMYFTPLNEEIVGFPFADKDIKVCFLKLTQARFIGMNSEIKDRFKTDRNTYIQIED